VHPGSFSLRFKFLPGPAIHRRQHRIIKAQVAHWSAPLEER